MNEIKEIKMEKKLQESLLELRAKNETELTAKRSLIEEHEKRLESLRNELSKLEEIDYALMIMFSENK